MNGYQFNVLLKRGMFMKKVIINIFIIIFSIILIFSVFNFLFDNKKEIDINKENQNELLELIKEEYDYPEQITKVKMKTMLGDGELYLYNNFKLKEKTLISEESDLYQYIIENGNNSGEDYIICCFISLLGLIVCIGISKK